MMKMIHGKIRRSILLAGLVLLIGAGCANTPPILGTDGAPLPGSIASLEKAEVLDTAQWLLIRGRSTEAPVLLWLSGGPGGSEIGWTRKYLSGLERDFILINWEQPGAGKSYSAADARSMTVKEYVDHTVAVSEYLAKRFGKEKILLAGHSWGSVIGILAAQRRPDLYRAYIGIGQHVNAPENDNIGYDLVLRRAADAGDERTVAKLKENGPPPYTTEEKGKYAYLFQRLFAYSPSAPGSVEVDSMAFLNPGEYHFLDSVNLIRGLIESVNYIYPQLNDYDLETMIPELEIPAYFVTGRYDYTCVQDIAFRFYRQLKAPAKEFYWFENSGHNACFQEPDKFVSLMREIASGPGSTPRP
jgi:pimeloyl-ACP methyl ester carboxylesterase